MLSLTGGFVSSQQKEKPNVIIILSDDQGWADVGFNGATEIPTPNLDKLASEGVRFTQGYASHPYCSPSRAGLLSGRYQHRFGHENNLPYKNVTIEDGLPVEEKLISEVMKENGYKTCAIGKWHLGDSARFWPSNRGFDDWYGFTGGGMSYWGKEGSDPSISKVLRDGQGVPMDEITYLTDNFSDEAVNYIEEYTSKDQPYFMYLAYNAPHNPMHATREYLDVVDYIEYGDRGVYAAMVTGMDAGIGKVIDKLKETGTYDNTLIFFYSDNGGAPENGSRNFPYRGHKGMLFEGGIRVPFLVTWPDQIDKGKDYHQPITALDIFPTILSATGASTQKEAILDGRDLLPYLSGKEKKAPHETLFWRYSDGAGYAVRKGDYKMVMSGFKNDFFLFDMKSDPYEHVNLAARMPEKIEELKSLYAEWTKGTVSSLWQDPHLENVIKEEKALQQKFNKASAGERR
ncbi:MAG: sulfatase [Cyclobacteriaceae bacterium]